MKTTYTTHLSRILPALASSAGLMFMSLVAQAQTIAWDAGVDTNWDTTTANWTGSIYTDAADVVFDGTNGLGVIDITASVTPNSINNTTNAAGYTFEIESGGKLRLTGETINSNIVFNGGSGGGGRIDGVSGSNTINGNLTLNAGMDIRGNDITWTGGINSAGDQGISINGARHIFNTNPIDLNNGVLTFTSAGDNIANASQINVGGNDWGTMRVNFGGYVLMGGADFLPSDADLSFGWTSQGASSGVFDLNGFNQTTATLYTYDSASDFGGNHRITSTGGAATLNVTQSANSEYQGRFEGDVALTKDGTGQLTLNNLTGTASSNTGNTLITNGTLRIESDNGDDALGTGTITVGNVNTGANLVVADGVTLSNDLTVNGNGGGTVKLNTDGGTATFDGTVAFESFNRIGGGGTMIFNDTVSTSTSTQLFVADAEFNSTVNFGSFEIWQHVSDTTFNTTGNSWGRQVIAFGGSTTVGVDNALDTSAGIQFGWGNDAGWNSSSLNLNGNSQEVTFIETVTSGLDLANNQNITGGGTLTVNQASGTREYQGRITDGATATSLVKSGAGRLTLDNRSGTASTFTGTTTISGGILSLQTDDALGTADGGTIISGSGKLYLNGVTINDAITYNGSAGNFDITGESGINQINGNLLLNSGIDIRGNDITWTGGVTSSANQGFGINGARHIFTTNAIDLGTGNFGFTSAGNQEANASELNVGGNDWGNTTINFGGYLKLGGTDVMPTDTNVSFGFLSAGQHGGTLNLNGSDQTVASIATRFDALGELDATNANRQEITTTGGASTLTVNQNTNTEFQGQITGALSLVKSGSGTLTLNVDDDLTNSYTGTTSVNAGTLALVHASLNNIISSSSIIDVATGATLDVSALGGGSGGLVLAAGQTISGSGTVSGDLTIGNGAVLSPGNSPGTLTEIGDVTWADGGTYLWEINNSGGGKGVDEGWDWIDIDGALTLSGLTDNGFTIDITSLTTGNDPGLAAGFSWAGLAYGDPFGTTFTIATANTISGFEATDFLLDDTAFVNGKLEWSISLLDDLGRDSLVLSAVFVPEPSSTALLGLGGLALMLRRKRSAA